MDILRRHWVILMVGCLLVIISIAVVLSFKKSSSIVSSDNIQEQTISSFSKPQQQSFEQMDQGKDRTDIKKETLPEGIQLEYGTHNGPFTPDRINELRSIVPEQPQSFIPSKKQYSFIPAVVAADGVDSIVIDNRSGMVPTVETDIKDLFRNRKFLWTETELTRLGKIIIVPRQADLGGALGVYDYVIIRDRKGNFVDWKGIIYIWAQADIGVVLSHEYGHHFTNFWAAHRTQGDWDKWPVDEAGDYYELRSLTAVCSCNTRTCPYELRIWEIIAEDFRATVSDFPDGHIFADHMCTDGSRRVGLPDKVKVAAYIRALPLSLAIPTLLMQVIPTQSFTTSGGVISPTITLSPTPTLSPCRTPEPGAHSLQLGSWYPCK